jgi:hypothetical protein
VALPGLATACSGDATAVRLEPRVEYEIDFLPWRGVQKIDLLFVIDNSISMVEKRSLLTDAMSTLTRRLMTPICLDAEGNPTGFSPCGTGYREFPPVRDIHVGIITSSLGSHGGEVCLPDPEEEPPRQFDDRAELLPSVREGLYSFQDAGFLVWDPREARPTPDPHEGVSSHETVEDEFQADLVSHVQAVGDRGCGFEAPLEAWYRFLIDPEPVAEVTNDGVSSVRGPVNQVVLELRARFLRPDSLVVIVMASDENDCSIIDEDGENGWLVASRSPMTRASSECTATGEAAATCCRPCTLEIEGCPANAEDPECGQGTHLEPIEDSSNLRCYQQLRRFGVDLLYPWQRYVDALTKPTVALRSPAPDGATVADNPLFAPGADGMPPREDRAFLVGIVGVPWQDLARETSLSGRELEYLDASALAGIFPHPRWELMLGDPDANVPPLDPFMIESVNERSGINPLTRDAIVPSNTTEQTNAINGHEQNIVNRDDLQYACTFDLVSDVPCTVDNQDNCDCNASEAPYRRSLCEYESASTDGTQIHGKAYPSIRQLQVLKGLAWQAVTASICPKNVVAEGDDPALDPAYGYNPAITAMLEPLAWYLTPDCLWRRLPVDEGGRTGCRVIELTFGETEECSCDASTGRVEPGRAAAEATFVYLDGWVCGEGTPVPCEEVCLCEIEQLSGDDLEVCLNSTTDPGGVHGFCYVHAETADPEVLSNCEAFTPGPPKNLRFMGGRPPGRYSLLLCPN